jgi:hypothetical protein
MDAGGRFADFDLDNETRSLLKELPAFVSPECLGVPCPSKVKGLEDLVRSIQEFAQSQPECTKYQQITQELANTMAVQGSHSAELWIRRSAPSFVMSHPNPVSSMVKYLPLETPDPGEYFKQSFRTFSN